jgi:arylsulfatase A-like enzyme
MVRRAFVGSLIVGFVVGAVRALFHIGSNHFPAEGLNRLAASDFASYCNQAIVFALVAIAIFYVSYRVLLVLISLIEKDVPRRRSLAVSGAILVVLYLPTALIVNRRLLPSLFSTKSLLGNSLLALAFLVAAVMVGLLLSPRRLASLIGAVETLCKPLTLPVSLAVVSVVVLLNIGVFAYTRADGRAAANLVVISVDTLRRDAVGCYGSNGSTANIDRLAARGVKFLNAYVQMSVTLPSHAAYFTGRYPASLGLLQNRQVMPNSVTTMAEILRDKGYSTAAFISGAVLNAGFGISQGFQVYGDGLGPPARGGGRLVSAVTDDALKWIHKHKERPFFLWVHYYSAHRPYLPPERFLDKAFMQSETDTLALARARYMGEVAFADEQVGRLIDELDALGLSSKTMIVLFSDHGEGLGDHNYMEHQAFLYEEQVWVPMIMVFPGVLPDHAAFEGFAQSVDLLPTVLDALGLQFEGKAPQGRSLLAALTSGTATTVDKYAFGQRRRFLQKIPIDAVDGTLIPLADRLFYVRSGHHKLIWSDESVELYDLASDPLESSNIASDAPETVAELLKVLQAWVTATAPQGEAVAPFADEKTVDRLRSLGYVD